MASGPLARVVRRIWPAVPVALAVVVLGPTGSSWVSGETTTTVPGAVNPAVTTVPEGCPPRPGAQAVFVGVARRIADGEVVFEVSQLRSGSLEGFAADGAATVVYGSDARLLSTGRTYIVGVTATSAGRLASSVREDTEPFGGAAVIGVTDQVRCPVFENAARTLSAEGTPLESGVLSGLGRQRWSLVLALVAPVGAALAGLYALAAWSRARNAAGRPRRGA